MKRTCNFFLLAALLCILTVSAAAATQTGAHFKELEAGRIVNQQRAARGLAPYRLDPALGAKARIKSRDMAQNGYFSHTSPTYGSPFSMMRSLGISYSSAGENIAKGFDHPEAVVAAWMVSDSHRENILSTRYTVMGIGYDNGYWTQWFLR